MNPLLRGRVKFFSRALQYGFIIRDDGGGEVFFHYNDGRFPSPGAKKPEFDREKVLGKDGRTHRLRDPKPDEVLVFKLYTYPKDERTKASPWSFADLYDQQVELIVNRRKARSLRR